MSIMRISSLEFGLLLGGGVWLLPCSIVSISSSSTPFVGFSMNVGLEDIFLELLLLSRNSYKITITVNVPNVSYSTGRITWHNQSTRLFTCLNNSSSRSIHESNIHSEI